MKVFVTGATGFIGMELLRQLRQAGHSARILARAPRAATGRKPDLELGVERHTGDILDASSLAGGLTDVEAVIHLVGIISEVGRSTFENIHTLGTRNVLAAAREAGVKRFLHMSALGTHPNAVSRYHASKWLAEEAVRQSGLAYTIFRPSLVYGPHDQFVNLFARIIRRSPIVPMLGRADAKLQPVAVESVARAFVGALEEPASASQTYDLCGPETFTLETLLEMILAVMGKKRLLLRVPNRLARGQAALLEFLYPRLLRQAPPLNRDQLLMLQEDNAGNRAPAEKLFGLEPGSFRDDIARYLKPGRRGS